MDDLLNIVRAYLQPITTSLPPLIRDPLTSLLTKECYTLLIEQIDPFTNPQCLKLAISKAIGIGIITLSSIVKVPQLLKLLNSKSSAGVSFLSYLLETSAYLITLAYNFRSGFPFSTFGETALIAIQNVIIAVMVLNFTPGKSGVWPAMFVAGLASAGYVLFNEDLVDMERLRLLQTFVTIPLGLMAKVPQIVEIFRKGGTGQLSAFAVSSNSYTSKIYIHTEKANLILGLQLPLRFPCPRLHHPHRSR